MELETGIKEETKIGERDGKRESGAPESETRSARSTIYGRKPPWNNNQVFSSKGETDRTARSWRIEKSEQ